VNWIRADFESVGKENTPSQDYERNTWPELAKLAQDHPEAGVHFQGMPQNKTCTQKGG
jgi:D-amino-acid oxidase